MPRVPSARGFRSIIVGSDRTSSTAPSITDCTSSATGCGSFSTATASSGSTSTSPKTADLEILREEFRFHPLSLEDSWQFNQRPKIDDYDGLRLPRRLRRLRPGDADGLVEVHCFYSDRFLITLHRDDAPSLAALRERYVKRDAPVDDPARLLHKVVDGLVDSFFPRLTAIDDRIDVLEDSIFLNADDAQLQEIFSMKRSLVSMRKVISPQRDLFSSIVTGVEDFPGMTDDDQRYFRDVYDHLIRIGDMVDTYRDLLTGAMDVYLSTVSNRLNAVMKQLAIIATSSCRSRS